MKKPCNHLLSTITTVIVILNVLLFYAIRSMWSGIAAILGFASPVIIFTILSLVAAISFYFTVTKQNYMAINVGFLILSVPFIVLEAYIVSVAFDSFTYFLRDLLHIFSYLIVIELVIYLMFFFSKSQFAKKKFSKPIIFILFLLCVIGSQVNLLPNSITSTPVVYAVNDEYQIVFTSKDAGTAWVTIQGNTYYDTYAGSKRSDSNVHKITIPMATLDNANSYTIGTKAMLMRGPYYMLQGQTIEKEYSWRGVHPEDGINYYALSDTHTATNASASAATYYGQDLDFFVCAGDVINWMQDSEDPQEILSLAGQVTNGAVPVIYARGNHETKGTYSNHLGEYTAFHNEAFYYTFRLKNIWGIVLDLGEDHIDTYNEYYNTADFNTYRLQETEFLNSVLAHPESEYDAAGVDYRIAICHIPLTIYTKDDPYTAIKKDWISKLNQMKLTILLSGHVHELIYVDPTLTADTPLFYTEAYAGTASTSPDFYATGATFPSVLVARKSDQQSITTSEAQKNTIFTGLALHATQTTTTLSFTTNDHKVLTPILIPWSKETYDDHILIPNK